MIEKKKVVIAMSGGVDSSVAAALLVQEGYNVTGMMLRLWSEEGKGSDNRCCTPESMALARRVAAKLSIPFYVIDAQDFFYKKVVNYFINGYAQGITPNPCLVCNRLVRWEFLFNHAQALGAQLFATGHYARITSTDQNKFKLLRAVDLGKDQSYVLYFLRQTQLSQSLFPLGEFTKDHIRLLAKDFKLPVADRRESQDLCFLAGEDYRPFLIRHARQVIQSGPIKSTNGQMLGEHQGLAFYTIGQRKGLRITFPTPLYVLNKDIFNNTLIVGSKDEMGSDKLYVNNVNWISGETPATIIHAQVKIRYKARDVLGEVKPNFQDSAQITLDQPVLDITPGQAAVFYQGEECLGGGIIQI